MVVSTEDQREQVAKLVEEKTVIEKKIASYGEVLHKVSIFVSPIYRRYLIIIEI